MGFETGFAAGTCLAAGTTEVRPRGETTGAGFGDNLVSGAGFLGVISFFFILFLFNVLIPTRTNRMTTVKPSTLAITTPIM
jgi:hypothetical protein